MYFMKRMTTLLLALTMSTALLAQAAQGEMTDDQLKQWAAAYQQIQLIDQEAQQTMVEAIEESGLEVQKFIEMQQAQANPNEELDATPEEQMRFGEASQLLQQVQQEAQQSMERKIQEEGLTMQEYQAFGGMIQNDPELQQKLMEYLQPEE